MLSHYMLRLRRMLRAGVVCSVLIEREREREGFTGKTLCLGVDIRKSEKKEFHIRDTSKGSSERLDFSIE